MKYLSDSWEALISNSYGYNAKMQAEMPAWDIVRTLYINNYVLSNDTEQHIPKKIHQIWLGGKLPEKYIRFSDSWQDKNPTYEYKLWTDKDVDSIIMSKRNIFNQCHNKGMKSDILRYEILRQQGGIYVDTDFECLKPLDDLLYLDFFTGISYDAEMVLYMGLIATVPNHPIIVNCVNDVNRGYVGNNAMEIMDITGPYFFTRSFLKGVTKDTKGVVAFPMSYFYPMPNNVRHESDPYKYILPNSYAIHHWAVSWLG
jgi:mannosyltransferase OCH1-like enzyme